jgi:hypothetical protein
MDAALPKRVIIAERKPNTAGQPAEDMGKSLIAALASSTKCRRKVRIQRFFALLRMM